MLLPIKSIKIFVMVCTFILIVRCCYDTDVVVNLQAL